MKRYAGLLIMRLKRKWISSVFLVPMLGLVFGLYSPTKIEWAVAANPDHSLVDVLEADGRIKRDQLKQVIAVDLRRYPVDRATLESLATLKQLRSLQLSGTDVSAEDLSRIASINSLESLDLRGCEVDTAGFQSLQALNQLKALRLSGKGVATRLRSQDIATLAAIESLRALLLDFFPLNDQAVEEIMDHSQLRELGLAGTAITDGSIPGLFGMPQLKKLRLASTDITGEGLAMATADNRIVDLDISSCPKLDERHLRHLNRAPRLTKLNLYDCSITNQGVRHLELLSGLRWLNLDKTLITDQSLESVGKLPQLEFLHIGSTGISAGGLPSLSDLKRLKQLIVTATRVSSAEAKAFSRENPSVEIQSGPKTP